MATPAVADSDQGSDLLSEADTDSDQAGQTRNLPGQVTQIGPDRASRLGSGQHAWNGNTGE